MADNVTLNSGSGGATLKTDELADTSHVQYVKLMDGTADGTGAIPGDATNGLLVNLGANNDVTVTGTVTVDGSGVTQPVSAASLPLPSGASTAANQTTIIGHVDGIETVLGTIDADTSSLSAALYTEDAAAAANPVGTANILVRSDAPAALTTTDGDNVAQRGTDYGAAYCQIVDSSGNFIDTFGGSGGTATTDDGAFTAGTGQGTPIMGFATSDVVDAGDVGVIAMDTSRNLKVSIEVDNVGIGGGTQYTEDAAAAANPVGNAVILVREDARAGGLTTTDGDNVAARGNNKGEMYVKDTDAAALLTTIDADTSTLAAVDYATQTTLAAINAKMVTGTDIGDVTINNAAGASAVNIQDGGNAITVDNSGTFAVQATLQASTNTTEVVGDAAHDAVAAGNPLLMGAYASSTAPTAVSANGDAVRLWATTSGALHIADGAGSITVDNGGTFATQAAQSGTWNITNVSGTVSLPTGASTAANQSTEITALQLIDNPVVAHDAAASGSTGVNMAGAYATNSIEGVTQVANADASHIVTDLNGVLVSRQHTTLEEIISERVSDTGGTSTNFTNFAAGGAGIHNYVTTISIYNSSATDGYVDFRDGSAGSIIFTCAAPAAGGSVVTFPVPLKGAANTALAYDVSGALSTVYISVVGFQAQG